jgi:hypothetical protein
MDEQGMGVMLDPQAMLWVRLFMQSPDRPRADLVACDKGCPPLAGLPGRGSLASVMILPPCLHYTNVDLVGPVPSAGNVAWPLSVA